MRAAVPAPVVPAAAFAPAGRVPAPVFPGGVVAPPPTRNDLPASAGSASVFDGHRPSVVPPMVTEAVRAVPAAEAPVPGRAMRRSGADLLGQYVGQTLYGQFRVETLIGIGSTGTVFRAKQLGIGRPVAIKVLHPELRNQQEIVARFQREAQIASRLSHPNIVHMYLSGVLPDGNLFLAMEYVTGTPLSQAVSPDGWSPDRAVHVMDQVLSALSGAHRAGIVHRDLKPENVMLTEVGDDADFVKVLDFGIARLLDHRTVASRSGLVFGSPKYISPEAASGDPADERSDVYSAGIILYELLGGRPPFDAEKPLDLLMMQIRNEPPRLSDVRRGAPLPDEIVAAVHQAIEKKPDRRYRSADVFRQALRNAMKAAEKRGVRPGWVVPAAVAASPPPPAAVPAAPAAAPDSIPGFVIAPGAAAAPAFDGRRSAARGPEAEPAFDGRRSAARGPNAAGVFEAPRAAPKGSPADVMRFVDPKAASLTGEAPPRRVAWVWWLVVGLVLAGLVTGALVCALGGSDASAAPTKRRGGDRSDEPAGLAGSPETPPAAESAKAAEPAPAPAPVAAPAPPPPPAPVVAPAPVSSPASEVADAGGDPVPADSADAGGAAVLDPVAADAGAEPASAPEAVTTAGGGARDAGRPRPPVATRDASGGGAASSDASGPRLVPFPGGGSSGGSSGGIVVTSPKGRRDGGSASEPKEE
jgi:serine/threonine-protein kinase